MGLNKKEAEYFQALVLYNQAKGLESKSATSPACSPQAIPRALPGAGQFEFLEKWYYLAVREVLAVHAFRGDYAAWER